MIKEDFVSFETAKLLKEKGFDERCYKKYNSIGDLFDTTEFTYGPKAPTHQMAMKWLREIKSIEVNVVLSALNADESREYQYDIFFTDERYIEPSFDKYGFPSYEEAVEAALKYCLTNII